MLADSMAKYVTIQDTDIRAFRGDTIKNLNDRIRFDKINLKGYTKILIHVGSNDVSNLLKVGQRTVTIFDVMDRYVALRHSIRRRNSQAVLIFASVLPRVNRFHLFRPYISGLNFALEKWCAKTGGTCIYAPMYDPFLNTRGSPNAALFSDSDGLHVDGTGVDVVEGCFGQAFSTGHLLTRLRAKHTKMLRML